MSAFKNQLEKISYINKSFLCIGLDPYPKYMPIKDIFKSNEIGEFRSLIEKCGTLPACKQCGYLLPKQ